MTTLVLAWYASYTCVDRIVSETVDLKDESALVLELSTTSDKTLSVRWTLTVGNPSGGILPDAVNAEFGATTFVVAECITGIPTERGAHADDHHMMTVDNAYRRSSGSQQ